MGFCLILLLFLLNSQFNYSLSIDNSSFPYYAQCHSDESSALFQFKNSFSYFRRNWNESTCERVTGHVFRLSLEGLQGVISSNSSLFSLRHLQNLDLSDNDFLGSNISPKFGDFTHPTHLTLVNSNFSCLIPFEIARLSKLVSFTVRQYDDNEIKISLATFKALAQNWSEMRELDLGRTDLSLVRSPLLRIMNLSTNEFSGSLPRKLFENFEMMMNSEEEKMGYMGDDYYHDSVMVAMKGFYLELEKILTILTTIDFSRSNFSGGIPESIGRLKALKGLNFSHNKLTGAIPLLLRNLTNLEWLDLSSNELVGEIPVDLLDITSLTFLNLSHNHLEGPIPQGKQFNTFSNNSYMGNLGLCGFPMTEKCIKDTDVEPMSLSRNQDVDSNWFDWKTAAMGYASGLVIGISLGYMLLYSNGRLSWLCELMIF